MLERPDSEAGFSLIEVIVSVVIMGIIIGPLTASIFYGLVTSNATTQRISDSAGAQLTSSYFVSDVQSSDVVVTNDSVPSPTFNCGGAGTLVELRWVDPSGGVSKIAAYRTEVVAGGTTELHRVYCESGTQVTDTRLVTAVDPDPTITKVGCVPADCGATTSDVTLQVKAFGSQPRGDSYYEPYQFTLTGARRVRS